MTVDIRVSVNGDRCPLTVDTRETLLDTLRERLDLTGAKKGCDHGQCGACTVLVDGRRVKSCLTLTVTLDDREIVTVEGLADDDGPHPLQTAFIEHDAFQCGYCTPGQLCSAVGMLAEAAAGWPSAVTRDTGGRAGDGAADGASDRGDDRAGTGRGAPPGGGIRLDDDEIRERMSGNLCRCGAYVNIVAAIGEVAR
ncbi:2Fe-2S iron-sulfur cluster-binding protein [Streptosporangium sp. NPDC051023]|uniref:(2Fe-2S)-binding protein n=1 Tax=Streptosporangium sp. NPDC051023 TaxID=3155410 RepID=UPI00344F0C42